MVATEDDGPTFVVKYKEGDCVRTIYGAGVVTVAPAATTTTTLSEEKHLFFRVRLWRVPGQSIASAVIAVLTPDAVRVRALARVCLHARVVVKNRSLALARSLSSLSPVEPTASGGGFVD